MEQKFKQNLYVSILFQERLIKTLYFAILNPKTPIEKLIKSTDNPRATLEVMSKTVVISLVKENLELLNQIWSTNHKTFNESLIKNRIIYNTVKSQISKDKPFPFNNKEFFKRIRQAMVHNSLEHQNFGYNFNDFTLNLGKVDGEDYIIHLNNQQLLGLTLVLISNAEIQPRSASFEISAEGPISTKQDIKNKIKIYKDDNDSPVELEDSQIELIHSYCKIKNIADIHGHEDECLRALSFPEHPMPLLGEKSRAIKLLLALKPEFSISEIIKNVPDVANIQSMLDVVLATVSNLLFTCVSYMSNDELTEVLEGVIDGLDKETIRHLRNSLCHGRYFWDYNATLYFYDGTKQLSFKLKLEFEQALLISNKLLKRFSPFQPKQSNKDSFMHP